MSMPDEFLGFWLAARLPNLGLVSMAGNREPEECEIGVVDLVLCKDDLIGNIKRVLDKFQPEFVGLNSMTFQFFTARRIAQWIKEEYNPDIKLILGGYHASLCYDEITQTVPVGADPNDLQVKKTCQWADFIVRGEGEHALRQFIHAWRNQDDLGEVPGLSWKGPYGDWRHNDRCDVLDLSTIKLPDRSARLIKNGYYAIEKKCDVVETSRGCTNTCKFCSIAQMYGRGIRFYDVERVIADIKVCHDNGARAILFIDDNITLNPARLESICDRIIEEGLNDITFHTQAGAVGLIARPTLITKMGKAGFSIVFFGIENYRKKNLDLFAKRLPLLKLKQMVKDLRQNGMTSFGGFIIGNPDDNVADIEANVNFARYLDLDVPAFQVLVPFPKTESRQELMDGGWITNPDDYSRYTGLLANVKTQYLSPEQLNKECLRCYYRYFTPQWVWRRLWRPKLMKRYANFFMHVALKHGKLAVSSWLETYRRKLALRGAHQDRAEAEDSVLSRFEKIRDEKTRIFQD